MCGNIVMLIDNEYSAKAWRWKGLRALGHSACSVWPEHIHEVSSRMWRLERQVGKTAFQDRMPCLGSAL